MEKQNLRQNGKLYEKYEAAANTARTTTQSYNPMRSVETIPTQRHSLTPRTEETPPLASLTPAVEKVAPTSGAEVEALPTQPTFSAERSISRTVSKPKRFTQLTLDTFTPKIATQQKGSEPLCPHPDDFTSIALNDEERMQISILEEKWESRHVAYRNTSKSWQVTQERMLPLLILADDASTLSEEFECRRDRNNWSYATTAQYWSALLKASEAIGHPPTPIMRQQQKVYSALKREENPRRPTTAITTSQVQVLLEQLSTETAKTTPRPKFSSAINCK